MSDPDELLELSEEFDRVVRERDAAGAEALLHPDYALVLVQPAPAVMPRARWLEVLPDYVVHDWSVEERTADVDGDTAAVLSRITMVATVLGEDRSGKIIMSDVWRRDGDGTWRVWKRHSTPLSAGRMPGVRD
jgi:ketosteroid isomerase-like protein